MSTAKPEKKSHLTLWICLAIVAAIVLALVRPHFAETLHVGGEVFLRLLKMMVVPLVIASVMSGILGLGDVRKLGRPGAAAVIYYLSTTVLAVVLGLVVVNIVRPGAAVDQETMKQAEGKFNEAAVKKKVRDALAEVSDVDPERIAEIFKDQGFPSTIEPDIGTILNNLVLMLFTDNLFLSAAETNLLPLIVFSIIFAGMLTTMGSRVDNITTMITQINDALLSFILLLMKLAPLGIFCLVAARFGKAQAEGAFLDELKQIGLYMVTVLTGLGLHALVTLPLIFWFFTRKNPYRFIYQMSQALLTAFSTASSSATLPVTMECAVEKGGVSKRSAEFVLPLGATINMDGTALVRGGCGCIFIAQALVRRIRP